MNAIGFYSLPAKVGQLQYAEDGRLLNNLKN
jgi:hypothetical protein